MEFGGKVVPVQQFSTLSFSLQISPTYCIYLLYIYYFLSLTPFSVQSDLIASSMYYKMIY